MRPASGALLQNMFMYGSSRLQKILWPILCEHSNVGATPYWCVENELRSSHTLLSFADLFARMRCRSTGARSAADVRPEFEKPRILCRLTCAAR